MKHWVAGASVVALVLPSLSVGEPGERYGFFLSCKESDQLLVTEQEKVCSFFFSSDISFGT